MMSNQLESSEYNSYFKKYMDLVDGESVNEALKTGLEATNVFFEAIPSSKFFHCYAEGKWTPQEILLHIIDTERVFCYRAMYIARADSAVLEGFDENVFAKNSNANSREMGDLLKEYQAVRNGTMMLFNSFNPEDLKKIGQVSYHTISLRAIGLIICGHEKHHSGIIKDRYL